MSKRKSLSSSKGRTTKKKNDNDKSNKVNNREFRTKHRRVKEIVFDPESRKQYLCGFSERKKQRRAFGLAMQKVKDRKARIEQRAEIKQSLEEQIKEAEERKIQVAQAATAKLIPGLVLDDDNNESDDKGKQLHDNDSDCDADDDDPIELNAAPDKFVIRNGRNIEVYEDARTQQQWGGDVIVTTSMNFDDDLGDVDDDHKQKPRQQRRKQQQRSNDTAQEYSGKVERFLRQIKGSMPSKMKPKDVTVKHRSGRHGAANMPGIGGDANLKAAKKILSRTRSNAPRPTGGKKNKKQRSK
jgi:Nucleolar protein 12 (25kDa)